MAMWGNHIHRVKTVINDNIIEQVTDFKYLGYHISEYKSDLEDKLQTYNKIRLQWSRGSVLAFSTQVRGFKPGPSHGIFRAKKSSARLPSEGK
jgi:predicted SPOUT superfamily RNA methylase MTH1